MAGRCACAQTCNCCTNTTPSIAVAGTGSAESCFAPEVRYSSDAGNRARAGADGAVYADTCLLDPAGEPIEPDEDACLQIPPPVIHTYGGGDVIEPNPDGSIDLPTSGPPPDYGCGFTVDEDGALIANTASWPGDDAQGHPIAGTVDEGSGIYCDPATGELRGAPEHTSIVQSWSGTLLAPTLEVVSTTYTSPDSPTLVVTNPSPNRILNVVARLVAVVDLVSPARSGAIVKLQYRDTGLVWTTVREVRWVEAQDADGPTLRESRELTAQVNLALSAGDFETFEVRVVVSHTGVGDDPTVVSVLGAVSALGVTM